MDKIQDWAVLLCISSVISGMLVFLVPDGKLRKTANIVISVFLLTACVSLFSDKTLLGIDFDTDLSVNAEIYTENINEYLIEQSKKTTEDLIADELKSICSYPYAVDTQWNATNNNISLIGVTVAVSSADVSRISGIKTKIGALTGIVPEVSIV